jgi:hypothetical protein
MKNFFNPAPNPKVMRAYNSKGKLATVRANFDGKVIVAGDLHGDLEAFERIRDLFVQAPGSLLIFLGDYADRGSHGLEVIEGVKELMEKFEGRVIALKGNHEDYRDGTPSFSPCDLPSEVEAKKSMRWSDFFPQFEREFLNRLHLAALIPGLMLLVHGGISSKLKGLGDLKSPPASVEEDILWSDPHGGSGEYPNPRGAGILFSPETSEALLRRVGVRYLVRSHEPRKAIDGPCMEHSGRVFTLSSTRVYGGRAFVLVFRPDPALTPDELHLSTKYLLEPQL